MFLPFTFLYFGLTFFYRPYPMILPIGTHIKENAPMNPETQTEPQAAPAPENETQENWRFIGAMALMLAALVVWAFANAK